MGLDITYCAKAERLRDFVNEDYDYDKEDSLYVNPGFIAQADGLTDGIYAVEGTDSFRAGSYGSYNHFREQLARMVGYSPDDAWEGRVVDRPFIELINFSDCEGSIGPKTSAKLANDFAAHQATAGVIESNVHDATFAQRYRQFRAAFETAAKGGYVSFH